MCRAGHASREHLDRIQERMTRLLYQLLKGCDSVLTFFPDIQIQGCSLDTGFDREVGVGKFDEPLADGLVGVSSAIVKARSRMLSRIVFALFSCFGSLVEVPEKVVPVSTFAEAI